MDVRQFGLSHALIDFIVAEQAYEGCHGQAPRQGLPKEKAVAAYTVCLGRLAVRLFLKATTLCGVTESQEA